MLLDSLDITGLPPYERPINMMFQSYALFPHMSVADNIAFGLKQEHLPKAQIRQRIEQMLDLVQMRKLAQRLPHQLSGGQQQRAALRARWPSNRSCCCSTSRSARSTRRSASRPGSS